MNPYAVFLGDANAREVISATADRLSGLAARLGDEGLRRSPAPGKWSATAILCHLADCEVVFAYRLRQALAQPYHVIQPFDQDDWAAYYESRDPHVALAVFSATRQWNIALIESMSAADLAKKLTHPERGEMTIETVVETMAGHDLNHIAQIERIAGRTAGA
jgi:hypothetical protein